MANVGAGIKGTNLYLWDLIVIVLYFIIILLIGLYSSKKHRQGNIDGYFLASRSMHWVPVGASLFASCIGSGHFIGLTGAGAASGLAVSSFELGAVFILIMLGWLFVPVYISSGVYTMPEYLKERFGGQRIQLYLSFLSLILYIFTKISAELYAGALFIQMALNQSSDKWLYISIFILLLIAAVFTIAGGLAAVMWTDLIQTILMIIGALILTGITFSRVGGINAVINDYPYAIAELLPNNTSCGLPRSDYMSIFRTIEPGKSAFPWTGIVFGLTINAIWYWCTDQVIVQRALASRSMYHAKAGCVFASYIKMFPLWILIIPGMAARILFPDTVGCSSQEQCYAVCGSKAGCSNIAYIELVLKLMPTGLSGMMLAVMLAALMSSLTSIFNSASTIFTIDVWTKIRKKPSEVELLLVGRLFVILLLIVSIIWIPVIRNSGNSKLFDYIQSVTGFLAPPISAVFILAIFCKRVNESGAFWSLMVGLVIGMIRFILEFSYPPPLCGFDDTRPILIQIFIGRIHYLHFSCILFVISIIMCLGVSLLTKPMPKNSLHRLTYWTIHSSEIRVKLGSKEKNEENRSIQMTKENKNSIDQMEQQADAIRNRPYPAQLIKFLGAAHLLKFLGGEASGNKNQVSEVISDKEKAIQAAEFMKEDPFWKRVVNINAVICLGVACFIIGFFAI